MLNFFVHLENSIGVPYILIGSPKAFPLFSGEFRQARRCSEQGDFHWERMRLTSEDDETKPNIVWREFIDVLWEYQYLKNPTKLSENILEDKTVMTLYNLSQGIPAIALTLFVLAQNRAILSGIEKLTPAIFKSAEKDRQNLVRKGIDQIRSGQGVNYDDILDIDSTFWTGRKRASRSLNLNNSPSFHNFTPDKEEPSSVPLQEKGIQLSDVSDKKLLSDKSVQINKDKNEYSKKECSEINKFVKEADEFLDF